MIQTPSRSFAGGPLTPFSNSRNAPDYAQRIVSVEHQPGNSQMPSNYNTPIKGPELKTPSRPPFIPMGTMVSPGLSPITRGKPSGKRTNPSSPPSSSDAKISRALNEVSSGSSGVKAIPMPALSQDQRLENSPSRNHMSSNLGSSDDGSVSLPAYGFVPDETVIEAKTPLFAVTPPRDQKPITPAPRSLSALKRAGEGLNINDTGDAWLCLEREDDEGRNIISETVTSAASFTGKILKTISRESDDYSSMFEDDISESAKSSEHRVTTPGMKFELARQMKDTNSPPNSRPLDTNCGDSNGGDVTLATERSLQLISMLDISAGTLKTMVPNDGATPVPLKDDASSVYLVRGESSDSMKLEKDITEGDVSLSFSLSNSNVKGDLSSLKPNFGTDLAGFSDIHKSDTPVGIAFSSQHAGLSLEPFQQTQIPLSPPNEDIDELTHHDISGPSSDNTGIRDAMMKESLEIDWTFVKSPVIDKRTVLKSAPSTPLDTNISQKAASRYDKSITSDHEGDEKSLLYTEKNDKGLHPPKNGNYANCDTQRASPINGGSEVKQSISNTIGRDTETAAKCHESMREDDHRRRSKASLREHLKHTGKRRQPRNRRYSWPPRRRRDRGRNKNYPFSFPNPWLSLPPTFGYSYPPPFGPPYYSSPFFPPMPYDIGAYSHRAQDHFLRDGLRGRMKKIYRRGFKSASTSSGESTTSFYSDETWTDSDDSGTSEPNYDRNDHKVRKGERKTSKWRRSHPSTYGTLHYGGDRRNFADSIFRKQQNHSPPPLTAFKTHFYDQNTSYHIPPAVLSPSFKALERDRHISLYKNGKLSQKTSMQTLVNGFKKTYQSYQSPVK